MAATVALLAASSTLAGAGGQAYGQVVADGQRWAAWPAGAGQVVVYDDHTQRQRKVAVPDCALSAVGSARVLMSCPGAPAPLPVLVDIRSGARREVPEVESQTAFLDRTSWVGVGTKGLLAEVTDISFHARVNAGYDFRADTVRGLDDPTTAIDLDSPGLARPLCSPLRRTRSPEDPDGQRFPDPYVPLAYARPWGVETVPVYRRIQGGWVEDGKIRARRCGQRRPDVIARACACKASFGAGLVAWRQRSVTSADPRRARAFELATERRRSWRVSARHEVAQAGRTLVLWAPGPRAGAAPSRLRLVRWP